MVRTYEEFFRGYKEDADDVLDRTFGEIGTFDDMVVVRDIPFYTHCEHHMVPVIGRAHVAYFPIERVVGLSKFARVIDIYPTLRSLLRLAPAPGLDGRSLAEPPR